MPGIIIREYHPESGALLGNVTTLKFGRVSSGTQTRVKVIDIVFTDADNIGNVKLGLISNAGITVNESPQGVQENGSSSNGNFGIEDTQIFDSSKAATSLARHFRGLNGTATASDENNVEVETRSSNVSNYIYLDVKISATISGSSNGAYKVFFDYS